jgi:putative toxin-antitoxin system antitoxin component (TIGR02293 family)
MTERQEWHMVSWGPSSERGQTNPGREFFERVFGTTFAEEAFDRIEQGLSTKALDNLVALVPAAGQSMSDVLKVSPRTLARRRREGRLNPVESDRLYRLVELYAHATEVFGGIEAADEWMRSPEIALGDRAPLEYAVNEVGANRVQNLLTRIEHGVFS